MTYLYYFLTDNFYVCTNWIKVYWRRDWAILKVNSVYYGTYNFLVFFLPRTKTRLFVLDVIQLYCMYLKTYTCLLLIGSISMYYENYFLKNQSNEIFGKPWFSSRYLIHKEKLLTQEIKQISEQTSNDLETSSFVDLLFDF